MAFIFLLYFSQNTLLLSDSRKFPVICILFLQVACFVFDSFDVTFKLGIIFTLLLILACDLEKDGECSETDTSENYKLSSDGITDRNSAGNGKFHLTVYNPVANTGNVSLNLACWPVVTTSANAIQEIHRIGSKVKVGALLLMFQEQEAPRIYPLDLSANGQLQRQHIPKYESSSKMF